MPISAEDHIDNLVRHIRLVQDACLLLGTRLIRQGHTTFGRQLIARGFQHDVSKFSGIEWKYLHSGKDVPKHSLKESIEHHQETNDHHPEFWGGISEMSDICVAEMVCDCFARSQEFGTGLRDWFDKIAVKKYKIPKDDIVRINKYINLLLEDPFVKMES